MYSAGYGRARYLQGTGKKKDVVQNLRDAAAVDIGDEVVALTRLRNMAREVVPCRRTGIEIRLLDVRMDRLDSGDRVLSETRDWDGSVFVEQKDAGSGEDYQRSSGIQHGTIGRVQIRMTSGA